MRLVFLWLITVFFEIEADVFVVLLYGVGEINLAFGVVEVEPSRRRGGVYCCRKSTFAGVGNGSWRKTLILVGVVG